MRPFRMHTRASALRVRAACLWGAQLVFLLCAINGQSQDVPPAAQASGPRSGAPALPAVRVTTRLVQIGVTVHDAHGAVADLTKDDFTLFERGKPQHIDFFSVISSATEGPPAEPLPQNTFSDLPRYNPAAPGSITIVLLDNLNALYGSAPAPYENTPFWLEDHALANAKAHLLEYLKKLDPQERVAIYGLSQTLRVLCDFTSDRERLLSIVRNYDPRARTSREIVEPATVVLPGQPEDGTPPPIDAERTEMAQSANAAREAVTLAALKAIADHVANIPGRKNLVWLTANLPFSAEDIAAVLSPAQIAAYPVDGRGLAARNGLKFLREGYEGDDVVLNRVGLEDTPTPTGIDTMLQLAALTGGKAFVNNNDLTGAIREAVEDASVLYTLGFYIDAATADGKFHEVKVQVKGKDLRVRFPKGYFAYKDEPSTDKEVRTNWVTALRSPVASSAIPVQAKILRVSEPAPDTLSIEGTIDVRELRLMENGSTHEGAVDVAILEQDLTGKIVSQSINRLHLRMTAEQYATAVQGGVRFEKHVAPAAGAATLRIVVQDAASAQVGSLIIPLSQIQ